MSKHVYLIGMMGSGKSTVGLALSEYMGWDFIDLDAFIEADEKKTIPELFESFGESYFRTLEYNALERITQKSSCIISTGGGIVLNPQNIQVMRDNGLVVYLVCNAELLANRLMHETSHRPLLKECHHDLTCIQHKINALLEKRHPLYQAAAELIIAPASIDQLVEQIAFAVSQT